MIILKSVSYTRISFQIILYNEHIASLCVKSSPWSYDFGMTNFVVFLKTIDVCTVEIRYSCV
jgi:hypothetical protein